MTFLSLFAGIGGMDLGLERAGMRCIGQVEIDPYCRAVLAKHWPDVPRFDDVRTFTAGMLDETHDLICGGFPCQDISNAGKRAGISGERSGLWSEFTRIIREVRPQYVFVENVRALLIRGFDRVLGDLANCGYDAEWDRFPASAVGAPHIRERIVVVAYPNGGGWTARESSAATVGLRHPIAAEGSAATGRISDSVCEGLSQPGNAGTPAPSTKRIFERAAIARSDWWATEPDVGRVANGVPARVDRLKGLGNAVVPQVAEVIGRAILAAQGEVAA